MSNRSWSSPLRHLLGCIAACLIFSNISQAQEWLTVSINEIDFDGEPYTEVKIEVNPEARDKKVFKSISERLKYIQQTRERYSQIRYLLENTQDFVAQNYQRTGQIGAGGVLHDIAYGAAYKYPDPMGEQEIMEAAGNIRVVTKVDDFLERKSVTINIHRGRSLKIEDYVGTVKAVETDPARAIKDFSQIVPNSAFSAAVSELRKRGGSVEFEFENLSVAPAPEGKPAYDIVPHLMKRLFASQILRQPQQLGKNVIVKIGSMEQGLLHYSSWGFETYATRAPTRNAPAMYYMGSELNALEEGVSRFYSIRSEAGYFELPAVQRMSGRYPVEEIRKVAAIVARKLGKRRFDPALKPSKPWKFGCNAGFRDQLLIPQ